MLSRDCLTLPSKLMERRKAVMRSNSEKTTKNDLAQRSKTMPMIARSPLRQESRPRFATIAINRDTLLRIVLDERLRTHQCD